MANLHHALHLWIPWNANIWVPNVHEVTGSTEILDIDISITLIKLRRSNIDLILVVSLAQSLRNLCNREIIEGVL